MAIPAHLLGNPWARGGDHYMASPENSSGFDLTQLLQNKKIDDKNLDAKAW